MSGGNGHAAGPRNLDEALQAFDRVLERRRIASKKRPHFRRWVERVDQFRVRVLKRSFRTMTSADVGRFLVAERERPAPPPEWQLRQARDAVVMFLREVMGQKEITDEQQAPLRSNQRTGASEPGGGGGSSESAGTARSPNTAPLSAQRIL